MAAPPDRQHSRSVILLYIRATALPCMAVIHPRTRRPQLHVLSLRYRCAEAETEWALAAAPAYHSPCSSSGKIQNRCPLCPGPGARERYFPALVLHITRPYPLHFACSTRRTPATAMVGRRPTSCQACTPQGDLTPARSSPSAMSASSCRCGRWPVQAGQEGYRAGGRMSCAHYAHALGSHSTSVGPGILVPKHRGAPGWAAGARGSSGTTQGAAQAPGRCRMSAVRRRRWRCMALARARGVSARPSSAAHARLHGHTGGGALTGGARAHCRRSGARSSPRACTGRAIARRCWCALAWTRSTARGCLSLGSVVAAHLDV